MGGMGVPQIVESDAGHGCVSQLSKPILCQRIRLQQCAVSLGNNERVIRQPDANL
jgi:hypothetical protein